MNSQQRQGKGQARQSGFKPGGAAGAAGKCVKSRFDFTFGWRQTATQCSRGHGQQSSCFPFSSQTSVSSQFVNSTNEWHHGQAASGASGASGVTLMAAAAGGNKKGQIHLIERRHPIRPQLNMFLAMSSTKFLFYISD